MFDKRVSFFKSMQRIEARKWSPNKETFDQYVLAKMALMHGLNLPVRNMIHLLIGGILSALIRAAALSLTTESIEDFLDKMRTIAEGCAEPDKRSGSAPKTKMKQCRNCGSAEHTHQDCKKEAICFYCKKPGHRQYDCPAIKDKNRIQSTHQRMSSTPATVAEDVSPAEAIAYVAEQDGSSLELDDSSVLVDSFEGRSSDLVALIDTGSSVSFLKYSIYLLYREFIASEMRQTNRRFVNIKDLPLEMVGTIEVTLALRSL